MRVPLKAIAAALALPFVLAACATRPQVAHEGDLGAVKSQLALAEPGVAAPTGSDAALAQAIQTRIGGRVGAAAGGSARYRLQVAVATSPTAVGVSTGAGPQVGVAPWRSAPTKIHFWNRRGPVRTATLSVLDLTTGKVTAWSTVRSSSADPEVLADRLLTAFESGPGKV